MASTATKYAKLNKDKADFSNGSSSTLLFPSDLFSGDNQELTSVSFFFNKIKNNGTTLGLKKKNFLRSPYGDIPIVHGDFSSGLLKQNGGLEAFSDLYHRSDDSITLPLPQNLSFAYSANWAQEDLGDLGAAVNHLSDLSDENYQKILGGFVSRVGVSAAEAAGSRRNLNIGGLAQLGFGVVKNSYPEALFKNMNFRTIPFSWNLTPRTPEEATAIQNIARMFRFHMVPEWLKNNGDGNNFMLYPSSVDVVFWNGNKPHPHIPRMMTSVISNFEMNMTPNGGFNSMVDGSPQSVQISFNLIELRGMHKEMIASNEVNTSF